MAATTTMTATTSPLADTAAKSGARLLLYPSAALSLSAALAHLWAVPHHLAEWWGYGAFFVAVALIQGLYALALLRRPDRPVFLAGIGGNLALVSFYIVTRTAGLPFFGPHAGMVEEVGTVDLIAISSELALVATLVAQARLLDRARRYLALGSLQAFGVGLLLHVSHASMDQTHGTNPVLHYLQNVTLSVPLSVLAIWLATPAARQLVRLLYGSEGSKFSSRLVWALTAATAYAVASIPAEGMAAHYAEADSHLLQASRDAGLTLGVGFLLLLAVAALRGTPWETPRVLRLWRPRAFAAAAGVAAGVVVLAGPTLFQYDFSSSADAQATGGTADCNDANAARTYEVAAIDLQIPYNRWGGIDPHGQTFVLQGDKQAVKNWHEKLGATPEADPASADNRRFRPRPLTLRANANECVKVEFTNELDNTGEDGLPDNPRASMKVSGPYYDAQKSDGGNVGFNDDTTVPNQDDPATEKQENKITYYWRAPEKEGLYMFRDGASTSGSEADGGSLAHGLYGALAVEPEGSTWTDPTTGKPVYTGNSANSYNRLNKNSGDYAIDADIKPAAGVAFRETVQLSQDELPGGNGFGFNFGAEPDFNRQRDRGAGPDGTEEFAPDGIGEETSLSSWTYGDPALIKLASGLGPWLPQSDRTNDDSCGGLESEGSCYVSNVVHSYVGDPSKVRYGHAGVKETHVFHMHAHQWLAEPGDTGQSGSTPGQPSDQNKPESQTIDSQTYGPGDTFTADLLFGSGSKPGTFGDSIFHCHLYPHFADGFWALFRTHDVLENGKEDAAVPGSGKTPDGINVRTLVQLPDRTNSAQGEEFTPKATAENPGYPRFIPGKPGWRAPQAPGSILEHKQDDPATPEAENAPDDPNTPHTREDLQPAKRIVGGKELTSGDTAVEQKVQNLNYTGDANTKANAKAGAPFNNPCPADSREVTYNVSVIQTDVVYNEDGWHDTQGRIVVLDEDVDAILNGEKQPEPLFIRVNAGDCINYNLTNRLPNWMGNDAFLKLSQANMIGGHIHLVKFDVLGSDGASNGWNYQQAAFTNDQMKFNEDVLNGSKTCDGTGCRLPLPDVNDPKVDPKNNTSKGLDPGQTIQERWYADYELRTVFAHDHHFPALDQNRGYFNALIVEKKGFDFRNPKTGDFYQPINDPNHGPVCTQQAGCEGNASGAAMDLIGPGAKDDTREFGLAIQDFVSLTKKDGNPQNPDDTFNPPAEPEKFPDGDPGVMGINYRNAPFLLRNSVNGTPTDPAYTFSSTVHGDPATPLLEAYSEDPVTIRAIQGSQEEQHMLSINGMRWREEPDDPQSPLINTKPIGISEAFNFEVPKFTCGPDDATCAGDYLYGGTSTDDLYLGAWGILRARGQEVSSLLPLPDNASPTEATSSTAPTTTVPQNEGAPLSTSSTPPVANSAGTPCPSDAPQKEFNVVAMEAKLEYNKDGDNDPYGLIYALADDEQAIKDGTKKPEPLVLRANEGDCINVRLTNHLPSTPGLVNKNFLNHKTGAESDGDPRLPLEPPGGTKAGTRVSLHPQLLRYDVRGSDGATVGYNRDQTVGPTESIDYRWYADDVSPGELGTTNLLDFGDVRGHRHHGLFAGLNIEPKGATFHDPETGEEINSGAVADIRVPSPGGEKNDYREFSTFLQDGLNLRDASGAIIEDPLDHPPTPEEPEGEPMDAEDRGEKGYNYTNAPFKHRLPEATGGLLEPPAPKGTDAAKVFSSKDHGDPDTPIFRAYTGDNVRMRLLQGGDKPRQQSFQVSGHRWYAQPDDPGSNMIGSQGGLSVGRAMNLNLSTTGLPGDYRYGTSNGFHHLSGGLWGIMRSYPKPAAAGALSPTSIGATDDPRAGGHPILPLEIADVTTGISLQADPAKMNLGDTTTLSGKMALPGGEPVSGREVILEQKPEGAADWAQVPSGKLTTGNDGSFSLASVKPEKTTDYRVRFAGDPRIGLQASTSETQRVELVAPDTTAPTVTAPAHSLVQDSALGTGTVPVKLDWSAKDDGGVSKYELQLSVKGKAWKKVTLPSATSTTMTVDLKPSTTYKFRVRATDAKGNVSAFKTGPAFKVSGHQESSKAIADTGRWTTAELSGASGGWVQHANAANYKATFTLPTGAKNVEWVATKAADRGKAEVWLDEVKVADVDLYSATAQPRQVAFSQGNLDPAKSHKLEVRVLGQKNPSSTGTRVDVDAFVTTN